MFRFNCHGQPIIDDRFKEAINKWAKAKGVDPEHVFTANDWGILSNPFTDKGSEMSVSRLRCRPVLKLRPDQPINISIFEEAIIENI